jgi:hypothetical protein
VPPSFDRALPRELLRDVNDRVATIGSRDDEILSFLCECADEFCVDQVAMQRSRYEEIKASGGNVLASGHSVAAD